MESIGTNLFFFGLFILAGSLFISYGFDQIAQAIRDQ